VCYLGISPYYGKILEAGEISYWEGFLEEIEQVHKGDCFWFILTVCATRSYVVSLVLVYNLIKDIVLALG
jgi:hypothetical protein